MHMNEEFLLIGQLLQAERAPILQAWIDEIRESGGRGASTKTLAADTDKLVDGLEQGLRSGKPPADFEGAAWSALREALEDISTSGAAQGITAAQTSAFVLALKRPLFERIQTRFANDPARLGKGVWAISTLVDSISQHTLTTYQKSREAVIERQQQELLELSTPVVKLWEGVLAVPMIGTLDSYRTQLVMESLLQRIVDTGSELAIIDITGVPTVDTLVAQHLLKTVTAIRLMGADCIISGVRPQIAQTIVHLGIDLQGITTKASLADALALALKRSGYVVTRTKA
ncbi:Polyvinylalcohol dehydrogenase OS=Rhizobacter sp. Root404 OX=1736528 GN=ASC76_10920 PE=4 SV=1 [Rhizobacter fulvus]|jgi:rsbT co-antagonist protein RsbR